MADFVRSLTAGEFKHVALQQVESLVRALHERPGRTDRDARRGGALVAAQHGERALDRREPALLRVLHPRAEAPDRDLVLALARDRAGVTPDATGMIDDEAELHAGVRAGGS